MTFISSFRSEVLKTKRTYTFLACLIIAAATPFIILIDYSSEESAPGSNPWNGLLLHDGLQGMTILVLPMFIILLCTMLPQIEYRNNTWKQVLASPQDRFNIFISKFALTQLFIILFLLLFQFLMVSIALPIELMYPDAHFSNFPLPWNALFITTANIFVATLGMSSLLFWLGLRFKNFVVPIGVGLGIWILMMAFFELKVEFREMLPFALPAMMIFPKFADKVPTLLLCSISYMILFLGIAFADFRKFKMK